MIFIVIKFNTYIQFLAYNYKKNRHFFLKKFYYSRTKGYKKTQSFQKLQFIVYFFLEFRCCFISLAEKCRWEVSGMNISIMTSSNRKTALPLIISIFMMCFLDTLKMFK